MALESVLLLVNGLFLCLAIASAGVARAAARDARSITRSVRTELADLDLETTRNSAHIKRLTSSVGALGRWTQPPKPETVNGLPDPGQDPEKWRAAVRRMAVHQSTKPKGELQ
jgi:hypothetical protein